MQVLALHPTQNNHFQDMMRVMQEIPRYNVNREEQCKPQFQLLLASVRKDSCHVQAAETT